MRELAHAIVLVAIFGAWSCATTPHVDATCAIVCAHGADLGCGWATPTPAGHACIEVCDNAMAKGQMWRLSCLAATKTCAPDACP